LCLIGTRTVIVKKASHVPKNFIKAIEIDYDGDRSNAEADLFAITFPDRAEFVKEIPESFKNETGKEEKIKKETKTISPSVKNYLEQTVARHFTEFELGIISCKLPWNDFAVIPEHWDLVYELSIEMPEALGIKKITIGMDSDHGLNELNKFFYAFATMPSQKPSKFDSPKTLPIIRLKQLSGGNYWGLPTQVGVKSIKEIFVTNFSSSIGDDHLAHLKKELSKLKTDYNYFKI